MGEGSYPYLMLLYQDIYPMEDGELEKAKEMAKFDAYFWLKPWVRASFFEDRPFLELEFARKLKKLERYYSGFSLQRISASKPAFSYYFTVIPFFVCF